MQKALARGCGHSLHRLALLAAAVVACRAANQCNGDNYKQCFSATSADGCCGEGWEINYAHGRCSKCGVGKYKAWIAGESASNSMTKWNGYNNGHRKRCLDCPHGFYQDKEACNACIQCNGRRTPSRTKCCAANIQYVDGENCVECATISNICLKESRETYTLGECKFTNSFAALESLLPETNCLYGFSNTACISNTRITFSIVPWNWVHGIKDVSGDNKCKTITRSTMAQRITTECSNFQCAFQPSNECFVNKNSLGFSCRSTSLR